MWQPKGEAQEGAQARDTGSRRGQEKMSDAPLFLGPRAA